MIDIIGQSHDIEVYNTETNRAANILSIQLGALEYAQDLGIDLNYFLSETVEFQNESFKSYLVQVLANSGINVSSVIESIETLYSDYVFNLAPANQSTGLVVG